MLRENLKGCSVKKSLLRKENNDDADIPGGKVGVAELCITVSEGELGDITVGTTIVKELPGDIVT